MKPKNVATIFGGTNTEHEVSCDSARFIFQNLDRKRYRPIPILITKDNQWLTANADVSTSKTADLPLCTSATSPTAVFCEQAIDIAFPVLHGPYGEDGTIQGMLEMVRVPYVGSGVLASALCLDKSFQKKLCRAADLPQVKYLDFTNLDWEHHPKTIIRQIGEQLTFPCFVKPARQGSSIGITKVTALNALSKAINHALIYDTKCVVETGVDHAREIECGIIGNQDPQVSQLGEIIPSNDFYDYSAKYIDNQSITRIPAILPVTTAQSIKKTALNAYKLLNCAGLARIDFFVDKHSRHYLNEINTMPGFTANSMFPKLWKALNVSYIKLLDRLIFHALEQFESSVKLNYSLNLK